MHFVIPSAKRRRPPSRPAGPPRPPSAMSVINFPSLQPQPLTPLQQQLAARHITKNTSLLPYTSFAPLRMTSAEDKKPTWKEKRNAFGKTAVEKSTKWSDWAGLRLNNVSEKLVSLSLVLRAQASGESRGTAGH